jgi:hypothetical protein
MAACSTRIVWPNLAIRGIGLRQNARAHQRVKQTGVIVAGRERGSKINATKISNRTYHFKEKCMILSSAA